MRGFQNVDKPSAIKAFGLFFIDVFPRDNLCSSISLLILHGNESIFFANTFIYLLPYILVPSMNQGSSLGRLRQEKHYVKATG